MDGNVKKLIYKSYNDRWIVCVRYILATFNQNKHWRKNKHRHYSEWKRINLIILILQFSCSVVSNSLWPHEPQHARPPCPSSTTRVHPNSLSRWCPPTISSSVIPFSSCPQCFSASGSFQMSQLFASGGQSFGASASTSVLPMNTQDWSPLGWTGGISLQSKGLLRVFSNTTVQKHQFSNMFGNACKN